MSRHATEDREVREFRDIMPAPDHFEDGFGAKTVVGALFLGLFMLPGSMYLMLFMGAGLGPAARWVTVILFAEVARRSLKNLRQQETFILFYMTGIAITTPFQGLLWSQYLVQSDVAQAMGVATQIPSWVAPQADIIARTGNTFFNKYWITPMVLIGFQLIVTRMNGFGLGYVLYRITAHGEKLPFPMAPVGAQGILALTEGQDTKERWRWTAFSIGSVLGLAFGFVYVGIPSLTGSMFGTPLTLLPIPWLDLTPTLSTPNFLPAMPLNLVFDLSLVVLGMVLPFWAVVGGFAGLVITAIANPMLYKHGILNSWRPGMKVVDTLYWNNVDFYLSFSIGLTFAIFLISVGGLARTLLRKRFGAIPAWLLLPPMASELCRLWFAPRWAPDSVFHGLSIASLAFVVGWFIHRWITTDPPPKAPDAERHAAWRDAFHRRKERGDIPIWVSLAIYVGSTFLYIAVCCLLIDDFPWVFFLIFGFIYTPLVSYTTAKLEGMVGQTVRIPLVREASFILSGYKGVAIWFAPIPMTDFGRQTQSFRIVELTGTKTTSLVKTELVTIPVVLIAGVLFSQFIWRLGPIPSEAYPFTQEVWRMNALNQCLQYTATMEGGSKFLEALRFNIAEMGLLLGAFAFGALRWLGFPVFLVYGIVRGLGQTTPGHILPEFIGAILGRLYLEKKFGRERWRRIAPVVLAGFSCGMGLMAMASVGIALIAKSISTLLY